MDHRIGGQTTILMILRVRNGSLLLEQSAMVRA